MCPVKLARRDAVRYAPRAGAPRPAQRVYVAAPLAMFGTRRYVELLAVARRSFPRVQLLEARSLFASNTEWRLRWPRVVAQLDVVLFLGTADHGIGRGVWREINDARLAGRRVWYVTRRGLVPFASLAFGPFDYTDFRCCCRVLLPRDGA